MPNSTTNFSFNQPLVNDATDEDLWGGYLNDNWDSLDDILPVPASSKYGALVVQSTDDSGFEILSGQGTSGQVLTSNGADALPSFQDGSVSSATTSAEGIVELATNAEALAATASTVLTASNLKGLTSGSGKAVIITLGDVIIETGFVTAGAQTGTQSFSSTFSAAPNVTATTLESNESAVTITSIGTTSFNWLTWASGGGNTAENFCWQAIGLR